MSSGDERTGSVRRAAIAALTAIVAALAIAGAPASALGDSYDWADTPDPFVLHDGGRYYAYSTNADVRRCDGSHGRMYVPHRSSTVLHSMGTPAHPACFADVLPGGPGAWATKSTYFVWAPTVFRNPDNSRYFVLLYTAQVRGTNKMCIGRATASAAGGPFTAQSTPLICPSGNNWALDPNVYVTPGSGNVWVQWRQDASATESRIYGAEYSHTGVTRLTSARELYSSNQISWDAGTVENPAFDPQGVNNYLFFSGNVWNSNNYATGFADCGTWIGSGGVCSTLYSTSKPWIGYSKRSGGTGISPPDDVPGPGGMSFVSESSGGLVRDSSGNPYVAMHWWAGVRPMITYKMFFTPYGPALIDY
jgi:arabinan endo-1,5-alpha-L-arabinosidase